MCHSYRIIPKGGAANGWWAIGGLD
jgi:hypothetical protein